MVPEAEEAGLQQAGRALQVSGEQHLRAASVGQQAHALGEPARPRQAAGRALRSFRLEERLKDLALSARPVGGPAHGRAASGSPWRAAGGGPGPRCVRKASLAGLPGHGGAQEGGELAGHGAVQRPPRPGPPSSVQTARGGLPRWQRICPAALAHLLRRTGPSCRG